MAEDTRSYGTGKRKTAVARVWIKGGSGNIQINGRPAREYVGRDTLISVIEAPLNTVELSGKIDVNAKARGGGIAGQAGAVGHGIARALVEMDSNLRTPLRRLGFLTRDPRVKERKKYGRKRARRGFQFVKR
jgi:small subunit ribosomal protein S9